MKDWFKNKIWNWLFAKEAAERELSLSKQTNEENREYNTSKEFIGQMLKNAELELSQEKFKNKQLEKEVLDFRQKIKDLNIPDFVGERLPGIQGDFIEKYSKRYSKKIKIYTDKSNMKIKFIPLNVHALPPVKLEKNDSAYALFTPGLGDIRIGVEEDASIPMKMKLIIPEGYVGKVHTPTNMSGQATFSINDQVINSHQDQELVLRLINRSKEHALTIPAGQSIASLTIEKVEKAEFVEKKD